MLILLDIMINCKDLMLNLYEYIFILYFCYNKTKIVILD